MSIFCFKKIPPAERVCQRLKAERENKQISLAELSRRTHLPIKYLTAIEECRFFELPKTKAHRVAYVRAYAQALELNPKTLIHNFSAEDGLDDVQMIHPHRNLNAKNLTPLYLRLRNALLITLVAAFVFYLAWQIKGIVQPPPLSVYFPPEGYIVAEDSVEVAGLTAPETQLTINGETVMVSDRGQFSARLDLSPGLNIIKVVAQKKHGRTTTLTRHVVVRENLTVKNSTPLN